MATVTVTSMDELFAIKSGMQEYRQGNCDKAFHLYDLGEGMMCPPNFIRENFIQHHIFISNEALNELTLHYLKYKKNVVEAFFAQIDSKIISKYKTDDEWYFSDELIQDDQSQ